MKKSLLTIAMLSAGISVEAQFLSYMGDSSLFYVGEGALVYNGGGLKTVGSGKVDNHGNIMIVGSDNDELATTSDGTAAKTDGGNIILRLNDAANFASSTYGQLYISGISQGKLKGVVDKEYKTTDLGAYQQMAIPFFEKSFASLNSEVGGGLSDARWSNNEVLSTNNIKRRSDNIPLSTTTISTGINNKGMGYESKATTYYYIGSKSWDTASKTFTFKGRPVAAGISETLQNSGNGIDFGAGGSARNGYGEKYNTYLGDPFVTTAWTVDYGKFIYQFGNPFFTNLDLSQIGDEDGTSSTTGDGNLLSNLVGIRYSTGANTWNPTTGSTTSSSTVKTVTFESTNTGVQVPVGDNLPVIKPMETFLIKLKDNTSKTLNFDSLRRFAYNSRAKDKNYDVTAAKPVKGSTSAKASGGAFVKQVALVALNANGQEMGRTYYAVSPNAITGQSSENRTQATASGGYVIGSFEEKLEGGIDESLVDTYWLYINTANETNYKGKEIPVRVYNDDVKSVRVEIKQDAVMTADGISNLDSGESFYFVDSADKKVKKLAQGQVIQLNSKALSLFYGVPTKQAFLASSEVKRPSDTFVALDESKKKYVVVFDKEWKTANLTLHDMSGKLIFNKVNINTNTNFTVDLPNASGVYIITAVSNNGQKFVQKIKN